MYRVQGFYCGRWETEYECDTLDEATNIYKDYVDNCPLTPYRLVDWHMMVYRWNVAY